MGIVDELVETVEAPLHLSLFLKPAVLSTRSTMKRIISITKNSSSTPADSHLKYEGPSLQQLLLHHTATATLSSNMVTPLSLC
jgi:hypothetical protein